MTAKIIRTNNIIQEVEPKNGKHFSADELSAIVGGYIEIINAKGSSDSILVLNEDGKKLRLPPNELATKILQESGGIPGDVVVGDCLLCLSSQVK